MRSLTSDILRLHTAAEIESLLSSRATSIAPNVWWWGDTLYQLGLHAHVDEIALAIRLAEQLHLSFAPHLVELKELSDEGEALLVLSVEGLTEFPPAWIDCPRDLPPGSPRFSSEMAVLLERGFTLPHLLDHTKCHVHPADGRLLVLDWSGFRPVQADEAHRLRSALEEQHAG